MIRLLNILSDFSRLDEDNRLGILQRRLSPLSCRGAHRADGGVNVNVSGLNGVGFDSSLD
jgi:hypothetical protein